MSDKFFDSTIGALNTSMNLRLLNQNVVTSNIANADTPGYKAKRVEFEQAFRDAMGTSNRLSPETNDPDHISPKDTDPIFPIIVEDNNGIFSLDENTVDRAAEMSEMAENQLLYETSIEMLRKKLAQMRYAISEGGK